MVGAVMFAPQRSGAGAPRAGGSAAAAAPGADSPADAVAALDVETAATSEAQAPVRARDTPRAARCHGGARFLRGAHRGARARRGSAPAPRARPGAALQRCTVRPRCPRAPRRRCFSGATQTSQAP
jgi:hypothetical protein